MGLTDRETWEIVQIILFSVTIVSLLCGFLTLYIIQSMQTRNGYVLLVFALAFIHILYNLSYFLRFANDVSFCPYKALNSATGTAVCLCINTMSMIIYYTAMYQVSFRVRPHFWKIMTFVVGCSCAVGLAEGISCAIDPSFYKIYWLFFAVRFGSIIFNSLIYIIVTVTINLPYRSQICGWTLSDFAMRRKTNELIIALVTRLRYYPIVQILTGICGIWWDLEFGFDPVRGSPEHYTLVETICTFMYAITNPWAGIGYFLIFLYVQPSAYKFLCHKVANLCTSSKPSTAPRNAGQAGSNDNKHERFTEDDVSDTSTASIASSRGTTGTPYSSRSTPQPFQIHMRHSDSTSSDIEVNSFDADQFSNEFTASRSHSHAARLSSADGPSGWQRWHSRISSDHRGHGVAAPSADASPIPVFVFEDDLDEEQVYDELLRLSLNPNGTGHVPPTNNKVETTNNPITSSPSRSS